MTKADHDKCIMQTWGGAAVFGIVLALLLMVFHVGFLKSLFVGALAFVVLGAILSALMCEDAPEKVDLDDFAEPKPEPTPATSAPFVPVADVVVEPEPKPESEPEPEPEPEPAPVAEPGAGTRPAALTEARGGAADDLKKIKGVGPKLEKLLNSLGFYHFDQIATWTADEVAWVDQNLEGFKGRVSRDEWVAQAKALAEGKG